MVSDERISDSMEISLLPQRDGPIVNIKITAAATAPIATKPADIASSICYMNS
jgi:hypothetical protein